MTFDKYRVWFGDNSYVIYSTNVKNAVIQSMALAIDDALEVYDVQKKVEIYRDYLGKYVQIREDININITI